MPCTRKDKCNLFAFGQYRISVKGNRIILYNPSSHFISFSHMRGVINPFAGPRLNSFKAMNAEGCCFVFLMAAAAVNVFQFGNQDSRVSNHSNQQAYLTEVYSHSFLFYHPGKLFIKPSPVGSSMQPHYANTTFPCWPTFTL